MYRKGLQIHFVGIGGIGMSGIAEVLANLKYKVSGSDLKESVTTRHLAELGCRIALGHRAENIGEAQIVVVSSAVRSDNPEVQAARARQIPVIPRAEMLAELMRMKYGVAVAGTHGKTTTTSLVATLLGRAGFDPTAVIGGRLHSIGSNAQLGRGEFLVAEADESDGTILKLVPTIAVLTNIDPEHLDFYRDVEHIKDTFLEFINKVPFYGVAIVCLDEPHIQDLIPRFTKRYMTYGLAAQADVQARSMRFDDFQSSYELLWRGESLGEIKLRAPGLHNVKNSLAAAACGLELGIAPDTIRQGLADFSGVERRFQVKAECAGIMVVDDYGHHPTEIKATLAAAKEGFKRRIITVFQPHRYSRTQHLAREFATAFYQADHLIITNIYAAGEDPLPGVTAHLIYDGVREHGHKEVALLEDKKEIPARLLALARPGDIVITMGAGDIYRVGEEFIALLKEREKENKA